MACVSRVSSALDGAFSGELLHSLSRGRRVPVKQFVMESKDCKLFNPGIARDVFGTVDPNNPKTTGIPLKADITLLDNEFDSPEATQFSLGVTTRNHYTEADWNVSNRWLVEEKLKAKIDRVLPLSETAAAHRLQEESTVRKTGAITGKLVLKP